MAQLAVTNSASYSTLKLAADEIVTLFGSNLGSATDYASPPAESLGGTTVSVTDSAGITRAAQLFYVSSSQASVLMPAGVQAGPGHPDGDQSETGRRSRTPIVIGPVAPGLFTANATGQGVAAAQAIRVHADGTQDPPQNVAVFDSRQNAWMPVAIDLGSATDTVYLLLYGTGIRHYASLPTCTIGGKPAGVAYAGAQCVVRGPRPGEPGAAREPARVGNREPRPHGGWYGRQHRDSGISISGSISPKLL